MAQSNCIVVRLPNLLQTLLDPTRGTPLIFDFEIAQGSLLVHCLKICLDRFLNRKWDAFSDLDEASRQENQIENQRELLLAIRELRMFIYKYHGYFFESLGNLAQTHQFLDSLTFEVKQTAEPPLDKHWIIV